jgi:hypothetical protein
MKIQNLLNIDLDDLDKKMGKPLSFKEIRLDKS